MRASKKILAPAAAMLVVLAMTTTAFGGSEFVFFGYAAYDPDTAAGGTADVYGILSTIGGLDYPIDLDMDSYQYTVCVEGMVVATSVIAPSYLLSETYTGGTLSIYADAIVGGTAADYAAPTTFCDGELILMASVDDGFAANLFDFDGNSLFSGSGAGFVDFMAGTQLDALMAAEYYLEDWGFFATPLADENSGPGVTVPDGYTRVFDVKLTPPNDPTPRENNTWGQVKGLYR